jgi:hypothetical protein
MRGSLLGFEFFVARTALEYSWLRLNQRHSSDKRRAQTAVPVVAERFACGVGEGAEPLCSSVLETSFALTASCTDFKTAKWARYLPNTPIRFFSSARVTGIVLDNLYYFPSDRHDFIEVGFNAKSRPVRF